MRYSRILPTLGAVLVFSAAAAQAQTCQTTTSCSVDNTAMVTLNNMVRLTLSSTTTGLSAPAPADYTAGKATIEDAAKLNLTVEANASWAIDIEALTGMWSFNSAPGSKAAGDLRYKGGDVGSYTAITTTAAPLWAGVATATTNTDLDFETDWYLATDGPGNYALEIRFTITTP